LDFGASLFLPARQFSGRPGPNESDRKQPLWPWIVALLIGLPVLYAASFGPACWLCSHGSVPRSGVIGGYRPILLLCHNESPGPVRNFLFWYGDLFRPALFNDWPTAMSLCLDAKIPCLLIPP
jgi:hypothetical protein